MTNEGVYPSAREQCLIDNNFEIISEDGVYSHPSLPNWIIKSAATRIHHKTTHWVGQTIKIIKKVIVEAAILDKHNSLLRIAMRDRIKEIARVNGIDVVLPEKKVLKFPNSDDEKEQVKKYCLICQKLDIKNEVETIQHISAQDEQT